MGQWRVRKGLRKQLNQLPKAPICLIQYRMPLAQNLLLGRKQVTWRVQAARHKRGKAECPKPKQ